MTSADSDACQLLTLILPQHTDALSDSDLATLIKLLRPVVSLWDILGVQLGVPQAEIQIIKAKPLLLAGAPLSFLQEMLYIWLQRKPPEHDWPTVRQLCDTLEGDVLEANIVAENVKASFSSE